MLVLPICLHTSHALCMLRTFWSLALSHVPPEVLLLVLSQARLLTTTSPPPMARITNNIIHRFTPALDLSSGPESQISQTPPHVVSHTPSTNGPFKGGQADCQDNKIMIIIHLQLGIYPAT